MKSNFEFQGPFAQAVYTIMKRFEFSVTSWIRSAVHNKAVGGVSNSRHIFGMAVDCVLDDASDVEAFMDDAVELGLQATYEKTHVHLQWPRDGEKPGIFKTEA